MKHHSTQFFIRLFFILFLFVLKSAKALIILIAFFQVLSISVDKRPIDSLVTISQHLLSYFFDILEYITGISSIPPFPFSPWRNRYDP